MSEQEALHRFQPGDIYEDCAFHPVLCIGVDYDDDTIWGISLVDGSHPHNCSLVHCGIRRLSPDEAWEVRVNGPSSETDRAAVQRTRRWWDD